MGESLVYAIKVAIVVAATTAFVAATMTLFSLVITFTTNTPLGEIIGVISVYLPFNGGAFFGVIQASITAILAFLIAQKVYELLVNVQRSS